MAQKVTLFWFRRDLRLEDNAGLLKALKSEAPVVRHYSSVARVPRCWRSSRY